MIKPFQQHTPQLASNAWVASTALVMGKVTLGHESSIWYGSVLRGDVNSIYIGAKTNIQDRTVIHVTSDTHPTHVGDNVTVGHGVVLHGCRIDDEVLVGMGAVVLDGVEVGRGSIVAAGSLIPPRKVFPAGSMIMGNPGRVIRQVSAEEARAIEQSAEHYVALARQHAAEQN
jgi:carbonic anhydrase/acetyltransferase-like protein (isoleucine patch superfamily)